jgi:hypothetical protein
LGVVEGVGQVEIDALASCELFESVVQIGDVDGDGVDELEIVARASIEALLEDSPAGDIMEIDLEPSGEFGPDVLFVESHRQLDVGHPQWHEMRVLGVGVVSVEWWVV